MRNRNGNLIRTICIIVAVAIISSMGTAILINNRLRAQENENATPIGAADEDYDVYKKFNEVKALLEEGYYFGTDEEALVENAVEGMVDNLGDKYTTYFTAEEYADTFGTMSGTYVGIGVVVIMDEDGLLTVTGVYDGSPAATAGLKKGDKFLQVDDVDVTQAKTSDEIVKMIKGPENTDVTVTIKKSDDGSIADVTMTRQSIKIENVFTELKDGNIGYIYITQFDRNVSADFKNAIDTLTAQGAKGLVVDLRDNPGGYLDQVVAMCDTMLPKCLIVYTENKDGQKREMFSDEEAYNIPMVVLVNEYSASASEIFTGVMKDYGRAFIVGNTTFGKGLVQTIYPLSDGSYLRMTIEGYFTPSGAEINGVGITPDETVLLDEKYKYYTINSVPDEDDVQLKRAMEKIKEMIP